MKHTLMVMALLLTSSLAAASSSKAAGPTPSSNADVLRILGKGTLCYGAGAEINGEMDDDVTEEAEATISAALSKLGLKAQHGHSEDDGCTTQVSFIFQIDGKDAPTIFSDEVKLITYRATDGTSKMALPWATVWRDAYWGGSADAMTQEEMVAKMNEHLGKSLEQFAADYQSLK